MNATNNNTEDDVKAEVGIKTEDDEIMYNVNHSFIDDKYKDLIVNIFNSRLREGDFHLTEFDDWNFA